MIDHNAFTNKAFFQAKSFMGLMYNALIHELSSNQKNNTTDTLHAPSLQP